MGVIRVGPGDCDIARAICLENVPEVILGSVVFIGYHAANIGYASIGERDLESFVQRLEVSNKKVCDDRMTQDRVVMGVT